MAIDAGLGELGRNGLLITEKYGPRVRISKVLTNLPLQLDKPVDIGIQKFCERCKKCAHLCPSGAISKGEMSEVPLNRSNSTGIRRWLTNAEKCMGFWVKNSLDCSVCVRTCPWNKPDTSFHRLARQMAANFPSLTALMVWLDDLMGYGKQRIRET
jgi:reductive dehalogenase